MEQNRAEVMELEVLPGSRAAGKAVRDLDLPRGSILAAFERGEEVGIPRGDTRIEAGDRLVVFALPEAVEATASYFA
jgi:trk system potassium uptake protein TrkA